MVEVSGVLVFLVLVFSLLSYYFLVIVRPGHIEYASLI